MRRWALAENLKKTLVVHHLARTLVEPAKVLWPALIDSAELIGGALRQTISHYRLTLKRCFERENLEVYKRFPGSAVVPFSSGIGVGSLSFTDTIHQ